VTDGATPAPTAKIAAQLCVRRGRAAALIVDDPESVMTRALAAGAVEIYPVAQEHGWLLGRIADPFGHHWEIGKPLMPWPPQSRPSPA